ncbi:MAG: glycosidase [Planctomycetes bacterium]|jgi:predicted GH43/DUF377 family glycosyl hydrolase|nr:glycosidase [Planctomycetota bacterium]
MLKRMDENPLLSPDDLEPTHEDLDVLCTLNPAAVRFGDETLLLVRVGERVHPDADSVAYVYYHTDDGQLRVERYDRNDPELESPDDRGCYYRGKMVLSSMSHLRIARSTDGRNFTFDPEPAIYPATPYEAYGCEDPRITQIDETFYITYTAVSDRGVTVAMASTRDFKSYQRHGIVFPPYQKDVAIFPEKVGGMYVCRHRPYKSEFNEACIWTAFSPDLHCWGHHAQTVAPTPRSWCANRVGGGAPPIRTEEGWLEIIHGADADGRYSLVAMLSELDAPQRVISVGSKPVLQPQEPYEQHGVYGNCVFTNGWVVDGAGNVTVYYGGGDRVCAGATTTVDELITAAKC